MRKIIFSIIFCFFLPIFAVTTLEIVPRPVNGVVGTDKIVVRGIYEPNGNDIRIHVQSNGLPDRYYNPIILDSMENIATGYYQNGVKLSKGIGDHANTITLEELINDEWMPIQSLDVEYDPQGSAGRQSLWGRIANPGKHNKGEQRAIYFYPGTRLDRLFESNANLRTSDEITLKFLENFSGTFSYSNQVFTTERRFLKNLSDTKGPEYFDQNCWSSKDIINRMMNEIRDANVNIIMFVYWGDNDETIGESKPNGYTMLSTEQLHAVDNYAKILAAPTFPETCNYYLELRNDFCIEYTDNTDHMLKLNERSVVHCQCMTDSDCGRLQYCGWGTCFNKCGENGLSCGTNQFCNKYNQCIPTIQTGYPIWHHYYTHRPDRNSEDECEEIYTPPEYRNSGIDTQGRQYDAIDQLFKAAAERNLLVVPTLEPSVSDMQHFEIDSSLLKSRLLKLLRKYGNNPNWLQVYDKNGNPRKAIHISQAIGAPRTVLTEDSFKTTLDRIAQEISQELNSAISIGFLLDITAMPPNHIVSDYYFPAPEDLHNMDTLLGISTFGLPFNQHLTVENDIVKWQFDNLSVPLEDHLVNWALAWLLIWKNSEFPIIPDAIPGFDDRWRGPMNPSVFAIYGDNDNWRKKQADLMFFFNTAGFNLTIWNGYGEGYVWVPYRERLFFNNSDRYSVDQTANPPIPDEYKNLNLFSILGNPIYQNEVVYDNYCFAQYLFGMDNDWDCVPNNTDNCPDIKNPDQEDEDGDGVGDACDNCKKIPNPPMEYALDSEWILGSSGNPNHDGAMAKNIGKLVSVPFLNIRPLNVNININNLITPYLIEPPKKYVYRMQPDSDLDGIGDACDYESSGFIPETGTLGFANSKIMDVRGSKPKFNNIFGSFNQEAYIDLTMPEYSGKDLNFCESTDDGIECNAAVHFCAINKERLDRDLWGTPGNCSTEIKADANYKSRYDFGYSHGSDDFDQESIRSWRRRISIIKPSEDSNISTPSNPVLPRDAGNGESDPNNDEARKPVKVSSSSGGKAKWNWRKDWYEASNCLTNPNREICQSLVNGGDYNVENTMYYALSTSIIPVGGDPLPSSISSYTGYNNNHELVINSTYFPPTNTNKFARAARYMTDALELNYHTKMFTPPVFPIGLPEMELCPSCYYDIPIQFIGMNEIYPYDYVSRYQIGKDFEDNVVLKSQRLRIPGNLVLSSEASPSELMGVLKEGDEYFLALNTSNSGADWNKLGVIENWDDNIVSMSLVKTTAANFFIAERRDQTKHLYAIESANDVPQVLNNLNELPELVYNLLDLGAVSVSGDPIKLVYLNSKLYLLEQTSTNFKMYSYNGTSFVEIQGTMPPQRNILNVATSGKYMFLAGGTDFSNNALSDLWRFDSETDTWTLVTNALQGDFRKVIMQEVDGEIIVFNPVINGNRTFPAFEFVNAELVENIEISYFEIVIPYDELLNGDYCMKEADTTLQGGLEQGGECVPFTHPWYKSLSAGTTVYSLAGKENRLYVGTNDSIKIYDISDANTFTLVSTFQTNNARVYDMEIEGDTLFAATSKGLYKLDANDPDELEQTLFVATSSNNQYEIELYDGKVYVGDDYGIKIRDKETFSVLSSANSGAVYDFAIQNGEIAMFRSSFLNSGIQFRDAETLVETAYDYTSCYDAEIETYNGKFYLACDNYTYSFEADNGYIYFTQLSGDKRELQEVYTYNGYTYIPDGNTIKLSTHEDVPSLCGNGIIEGDEVCDGGQIDCTELDVSGNVSTNSGFVSGIAACNSTCDGYVLDNCTAGNGGDGW